MFREMRKRLVRIFEDLAWHFRPTVWVQPNMRALFIEYLELARAFRNFHGKDRSHAATIHGQMDLLWVDLTEQECGILDEGILPYPTVQEAMAALPKRGGTVRFGEGVLYLFESIKFPDKNIRLIGGNFRSAGTFLEVGGSMTNQVSIIGCSFDHLEGSPRDWSPRGEIPKDSSGGAAIQVNMEP